MVAEYEDLGVLGDLAHPMQPSELDDAADKAVEEAESHGPAGSPPRSWLVNPRIRLLDPSGSLSLERQAGRAHVNGSDDVFGTHTDPRLCQPDQLKDCPQPQVRLALGLLMLNPAS